MRLMAVDWALSRRCREDLGAPPPNTGAVLQRRTNLAFVYSQQLRRTEKAPRSGKEAKFLRCIFGNGVDMGFPRMIRLH